MMNLLLRKQFSIRKIPGKSNLFGKVCKIYAKSLIMCKNSITRLNIWMIRISSGVYQVRERFF